MEQEYVDAARPAMTENEIRQWTMAMHLGLLGGFLAPPFGAAVPAVMWFLKRRGGERIAQHGRLLVNAALCYHAYLVVAFLASFFLFGMLPFIATMIVLTIFPFIGAVKANDGEYWRYPLIREVLPMAEAASSEPDTPEPVATGPVATGPVATEERQAA